MQYNDLLFNLLVLVPALLLLGAYLKTRRFSAVVAVAFGVWVAQWTFLLADDLFGVLRNVAWLLFVQLTLGLLVLAVLNRWRTVCVAGALSLAAVGVWAFQVEPRLLEVSHVRVESAKLSHSLKVAVIADLQTDAPGDYELDVLQRVAALEADLVLLTGDYLQTLTLEEGERAAEAFRDLWRAAGIRAPRGVFAVQGDVDPSRWEARFAGLGIETSSSDDRGFSTMRLSSSACLWRTRATRTFDSTSRRSFVSSSVTVRTSRSGRVPETSSSPGTRTVARCACRDTVR